MHLLAELLHCPIYSLELKIDRLSILKSIMKWPCRMTNVESFRVYDQFLAFIFVLSGASASVLALITHASAIIY